MPRIQAYASGAFTANPTTLTANTAHVLPRPEKKAFTTATPAADGTAKQSARK